MIINLSVENYKVKDRVVLNNILLLYKNLTE